MGRLTRLIVPAALVVLLSQLRASDACICFAAHPQTQFCKSDFVALVRVERQLQTNSDYVVYRTRVHRVFKEPQNATLATQRKILWLWTPSAANLCAAPFLTPGKTWVIAGNMIGRRAHISLCSLSMLWSEVTARQRKGFRSLYKSGCDCPISWIEWRHKGVALQASGGERCLWESSPGPQDCQEHHGICMRGADGCSWVPSVGYKKCITKHQRYREEHRKRVG